MSKAGTLCSNGANSSQHKNAICDVISLRSRRRADRLPYALEIACGFSTPRGLHARLLDHLVGGGLQRQRDGEAEGFGDLEIDHQLELGRLLDRKRGGRRALENARDIGAGAAIVVGRVAAVADQSAGRDELARVIDRGQRAAASMSARWSSAFGFFGFARMAISEAPGTSSRISSSRLPPSAPMNWHTPVTLPPG